MQISWEKDILHTHRHSVHEDYYNSLLPLNKCKKLNERKRNFNKHKMNVFGHWKL